MSGQHYDPNWQSNLNSRYVLDLIERVGWTFLETFGAVLVASGFFTIDGVTDLAIVEKAAIAGIASVLAVIKGLVAKGVGSPNTAALLPAQAETPDP
jgi:Putative lactococcus lactis phage r1t holin